MLASYIGHKPGPVAEILRSWGLTPFREVLSPECFRRVFPAKVAPKTILIPEVVFWLMATVALGDGSMAGSIPAFWAWVRSRVPRLSAVPITEEAFCRARNALRLAFFLRLFADVVERFTGCFGPRFRWKGRRLLGIDGTEVELPSHPHLRKLYPPASAPRGRPSRPQARLVGLVGLWDGLCYAFRLTACTVGEQASARRLLAFLHPLDLLLADRNFPDRPFLAGILSRGADFLFHLPSNRFLKKARHPTPSGRPDEGYAFLDLPLALRRAYPALGPTLQVRILQYQRPGFRVSWLITSLLDSQEIPYEELVGLYHQRWRQETFHREWKHVLHLSNLRSHSACGILKEVLVQLTLNNVVRWIMTQACAPGDRPVDLQFLAAKRLVLAWLPGMMLAPVQQVPGLYRQLLATLAACRIVVRPGRSYPRRWDDRPRPKGHGRTAQPSRLTQTQKNPQAPN